MLLHHSVLYLFARGIPGLIGFTTIVVYTRMLSPEAYGQYALVVTGAVVVNAIFYHWLNASLLRFLPQYQDCEAKILAPILFGFIFVSVLTGVGGVSLVFIFPDQDWRQLILVGILLIWVQGWFTINLELTRSRLSPFRYGLISMFKAVIALGIGALLVWWGFGAYGALFGLLVAFLVAGWGASRRQWAFSKMGQANRKTIRSLLGYGLPLTASFSLTVVVSSTDRFLLAGIVGESATGLYAAGQGLAQQAVGVLMTMVNLAAYPIILRTLEHAGPGATRAQLRKNAILLFGIGLPVTTIFIFLAESIAKVFLGKEYQIAGTELIPWLAVAALFSSVRAYYYDLAFFLGRKTYIQMMIMAVAALLNVVLNLWLIPIYGLLGAAYASVVAFGLAMGLSAVLGRKSFLMPSLYLDTAKLLSATLAMGIVLLLIPKGEGIIKLIWPIIASMSVYFGCVVAFDLGGVRQVIIRVLSQTANVCKVLLTR